MENVMGICWEDGAVCLAGEYQRAIIDGEWSRFIVGEWVPYSIGCAAKEPIEFKDYQLNTIKRGDYIEASELDTEDKYNQVVEVFESFGFETAIDYHGLNDEFCNLLVNGESIVVAASNEALSLKRKLTYPQIMAIGELKRMMIECDKSAPKTATDLVQKPSHYQFFEGVEVIEIIAGSMTREQFKGYCLGNRIKYRLRAGNKDELEQEIAKSDKYVDLYDEHKHLCRIDGDLK